MPVNKIIFKKCLLVFALLMLFLPIFQSNFKIIHLYKLAGDDVVKVDTTLTVHNYFSGIYQKKMNEHISSDFGFRSLLIKIHNQLNFSLFNKVNAKGVIAGKNNYLFETTYINSYLGNDYMGEDSITRNLERLKRISDTLMRLHKRLMLVIAPSKPSYYSEFLPDEYQLKKRPTNYSSIVKGIKEQQLSCIDFSDWFNKNKYKSIYPLYPKHGNHWSMYGSYLAADSIIKYIESDQKIDLPNILLKNIVLEQPKNEDKDIEYGINLLFKLKSFDLASPIIITEDTLGKAKKSVLVIGDSFYWNIYNLGFSNCFKSSSFWYYNKAVYPDSYTKRVMVEDLNFENELKKHDIIIILATESNIKSLGWGFMDNAEIYFKLH